MDNQQDSDQQDQQINSRQDNTQMQSDQIHDENKQSPLNPDSEPAPPQVDSEVPKTRSENVEVQKSQGSSFEDNLNTDTNAISGTYLKQSSSTDQQMFTSSDGGAAQKEPQLEPMEPQNSEQIQSIPQRGDIQGEDVPLNDEPTSASEQISKDTGSLGSGDMGGNSGPATMVNKMNNDLGNSAPQLSGVPDEAGIDAISVGLDQRILSQTQAEPQTNGHGPSLTSGLKGLSQQNQNMDINMTDSRDKLDKDANSMDEGSPNPSPCGSSNANLAHMAMKDNLVSLNRGGSDMKLGGGATSSSRNGDLDRQIGMLKSCECIKEAEVRDLCNMARDILLNESNIQNISSPITICGDIHGQFYDLMELFKVGGDCPKTNYIFMGDFVDRGFHSVETFLLLLALKVRYRNKITLIRGNHESRQITQVYGFYDECLRKYGSVNVWRYCTEIFDFLPLAAIIDDKIFCVHGGLSPSFNTLDEIKTIDRKQEVPHDGAMCDLMWSDPEEINGWSMSPRGAGYLFGGDVVAEFCMTNNVHQIARAHQLVMDGYKKMFNDTLVTVWSAPNYCYRCGNVAAILQLDENLNPEYKKFEAASSETRGVPAKKPAPEYFL